MQKLNRTQKNAPIILRLPDVSFRQQQAEDNHILLCSDRIHLTSDNLFSCGQNNQPDIFQIVSYSE